MAGRGGKQAAKFGYDRRKGTAHSSGKSSLAVRSKAGRRAHVVGDGQWPQGLIDTAADQAGPAATGDTGVGSDVNAQEPDDWTMWDGDHGGFDIDTSAGSEPAITNPFFAQDETEGMEPTLMITLPLSSSIIRLVAFVSRPILGLWKDGGLDAPSVLVLPDVLSISCDCPSFRSRGTCIHHDLFVGNWDSLREMNTLDPSGSPPAVEIAQLLHGRLHWLSVLAQDTADSRRQCPLHRAWNTAALKTITKEFGSIAVPVLSKCRQQQVQVLCFSQQQWHNKYGARLFLRLKEPQTSGITLYRVGSSLLFAAAQGTTTAAQDGNTTLPQTQPATQDMNTTFPQTQSAPSNSGARPPVPLQLVQIFWTISLTMSTLSFLLYAAARTECPARPMQVAEAAPPEAAAAVEAANQRQLEVAERKRRQPQPQHRHSRRFVRRETHQHHPATRAQEVPPTLLPLPALLLEEGPPVRQQVEALGLSDPALCAVYTVELAIVDHSDTVQNFKTTTACPAALLRVGPLKKGRKLSGIKAASATSKPHSASHPCRSDGTNSSDGTAIRMTGSLPINSRHESGEH
ncbi:hypothetical protein V8E36_001112 [Tilletia maclaganii]